MASVCVRPADVASAATELSGSGVAVGTVTGFLCGRSATSVEAAETGRALADGAAEFDMVIDVGRLRAGDDAYVAADIEAASRPLGEDSSKSSWRTPV